MSTTTTQEFVSRFRDSVPAQHINEGANPISNQVSDYSEWLNKVTEWANGAYTDADGWGVISYTIQERRWNRVLRKQEWVTLHETHKVVAGYTVSGNRHSWYDTHDEYLWRRELGNAGYVALFPDHKLRNITENEPTLNAKGYWDKRVIGVKFTPYTELSDYSRKRNFGLRVRGTNTEWTRAYND